MGAFIEQRDGYGWATGTAEMKADEHGAFAEMSDDVIIKTIYIDAETGSPVFISKTIRVYWVSSTPQIDFYTEGFVHDYGTSGSPIRLAPAITSGYADLVFEGYQETAGTDVTIGIVGGGTTKVYINSEAGY